jgi:hypothetical protein
MNSKRLSLVALAVLAAAGIGWTLTADGGEAVTGAEMASTSTLPGLSAPDVPAAYWAETSEDGSHLNRMIVFKSPTCGCCSLWIEHLEQNGFEVEVRDDPAMTPIKEEMGVPREMVSCHTGVIAGRIVEGHVPAEVIRDFLADEDAFGRWAGIAVPGMPVGSPGMEVEGRPADAYDIVAFDREGNTAVFASR